jgi:sugar-specific transcriptional regulator TrmB
MHINFLDNLGLTQKEIQIYDTLLAHGEMLPGVLIKVLGLKRATVYKALYSMEEKGVVVQRKVDGKATFCPEPPSKLVEKFKQKVESEQQVLKTMQDQLPQLMNSFVFSLEKPVMTLYSGVEGLKQIYQDTLNDNKLLRTSVTFEQVDQAFFEWVMNFYIPEKKKRKIPARMMLSEAPWTEFYTHENLDGISELLVVPREQGGAQHSVAIYGDKVAFVNYLSDQSILGVVIHHPLIARTLESWFDMAWNGAKAMGVKVYK